MAASFNNVPKCVMANTEQDQPLQKGVQDHKGNRKYNTKQATETVDDDKVSTKDDKKRAKTVTSANLGKSLSERIGSWGAYLKSIRSKNRCSDSRGRTSLRIPCINLLDGTIVHGRQYAPTLNGLADFLKTHPTYEALSFEDAALTRSRRVLFQHEILNIQKKHLSAAVLGDTDTEGADQKGCGMSDEKGQVSAAPAPKLQNQELLQSQNSTLTRIDLRRILTENVLDQFSAEDNKCSMAPGDCCFENMLDLLSNPTFLRKVLRLSERVRSDHSEEAPTTRSQEQSKRKDNTVSFAPIPVTIQDCEEGNVAMESQRYPEPSSKTHLDKQTPNLDRNVEEAPMARSQEQSKREDNTVAAYQSGRMPSLETLYPDSEHSRKRKFPETSPQFAGARAAGRNSVAASTRCPTCSCKTCTCSYNKSSRSSSAPTALSTSDPSSRINAATDSSNPEHAKRGRTNPVATPSVTGTTRRATRVATAPLGMNHDAMHHHQLRYRMHHHRLRHREGLRAPQHPDDRQWSQSVPNYHRVIRPHIVTESSAMQPHGEPRGQWQSQDVITTPPSVSTSSIVYDDMNVRPLLPPHFVHDLTHFNNLGVTPVTESIDLNNVLSRLRRNLYWLNHEVQKDTQ